MGQYAGMSPERGSAESRPSELSVHPVQLAIRRHSASEDDEDENLACSDLRPTLKGADAPGQALKRGFDCTARDMRRPPAAVSTSRRMLDRKRDLNGDVTGLHGCDRPMRKTVQAVTKACGGGDARDLRAARR